MRRFFECFCLSLALMLSCRSLGAQVDRREVRSGNRQFRKENWQKADIDYRKALVKDTASFAANYNLASALYRQNNFDEAGKSLEKIKAAAAVSPKGADCFYNLGDVAVQKKDWQGAVDAYRQSLLRNPGDLDAKENYTYARLMLKNQSGGGDSRNDRDQPDRDQSQDRSQQDRDQRQDRSQQNRDQGQDRQEPPQPRQEEGEAKISPQQAQQMLKAIQAKEKETQDKVNKEKAAVLKSRQKEKNW